LPWLASTSIHRACWGVRAQVAVVDAAVITAGEGDEFVGEVGHLWLKIKEKIAALKLRTWAKKTLQQQLEHLELHGFERTLEQRVLADAINKLLGIGEWGPVLVVLCALDGPSVSCLTLHPLPAAPRPSRLLSAEPGECWMGVGTGAPVRCVQPPLWKAVVRGWRHQEACSGERCVLVACSVSWPVLSSHAHLLPPPSAPSCSLCPVALVLGPFMVSFV